mgnify:CR=1 FL=1
MSSPRVRWEPRDGGHVNCQVSLGNFAVSLDDFPNEIVAASGYGIVISAGDCPSCSGSKARPSSSNEQPWERPRPLHRDPGSLGGQDGSVRIPTTHTLRPLDVFSGHVGYEHRWTERLRSSASFGIASASTTSTSSPAIALHF